MPVPRTVSVVVPRDVRAFFTEASISGQGGFQSLCRKLSDHLKTSSVLRLRREEFQRIVRYSTDYGNGGFQARLRQIVASWVSQNFSQLIKE